MPVQTLRLGNYLRLPHIVPPSKTVRIDMEAEEPVNLHILLNDHELSLYSQGKWVPPISRSALGIRSFNVEQKISLAALGPPLQPMGAFQAGNPGIAGLSALLGGLPAVGTTWYLIIANQAQKNIAVFYRVYNV